jgi:autotransporter-associated beta strand protein
VTITSGGILGAYAAGNELLGGKVRSGRASGELFVHTPYATAIGSEIADNGSTPTILVKSGASTAKLTLTGANSYTGATFLNSGTLALTNNAALSGPVVQAGGTTLEVRDRGTLSPGGTAAAVLTLNGNLSLGDGARLDLLVGVETDGIVLSNPFATLTGATAPGSVTLNIGDGGDIIRQAYPLVRWETGTTLSSLDLTDFTVAMPPLYDGVLQFGANCLELNVTSVPATATLLLVR